MINFTALHSNRHPPASPAPHVVQETSITSIRHFFVWKPWENHGETMIQWLSDYLVMFSDYLWYLWLSDVWTPQRNSSLFEVPFLMGCSCAVLQYHCLCLEVFVFRARHAESFTDATHEQDILRHHGRLKGRPSGNIGEWGVPSLGVPTHDSGNLHPQPSATSFHWDRLYGLWSTLCFAGSKIAGMNNISQHVCALWAGDATKAFKVAADPLLTWRWKTRNSSTTCSCIYFPHWTQDFPLPASVYWRV